MATSEPQIASVELPDGALSPELEETQSNDEDVDDEITARKREEEQQEQERKQRERDAHAQALTLEMVGDLPFAEVKPPQNILFICKLNPVTEDADLELIFSQYGTILSCEIIRDAKTKDSLQYAFIEFDKQEDCERAYEKMHDVLIDDHRIHVDFSQSVSKLSQFWRDGENAKRKKRVAGGFGGIKNLERKTQYRDEYKEVVEEKNPDMVFDKRKHENQKRQQSRSKSPQRDRYSGQNRNRDRDRDRYDDRHSKRDRSRDRHNDKYNRGDRRRDDRRHDQHYRRRD